MWTPDPVDPSLVPLLAEGKRFIVIRIPFNRPTITGREREYVQQVLESSHWSGDGAFTKRCASFLETMLDAPRVLLTTSCTHALEMAALLLGIGAGDEVIVPSFTFVSTVNAIILRGARPVFVDIRPDTLNMDERAVEAAVTDQTRAIWVVHYAGVACEMNAIAEIAGRRRIPIVEDAAHALFGRYHGKALGTWSSLAALSFHETKNVSSGEGGALVLNDPALIERAEILREKGTNRSSFFRGQVDKYTWVDVGSSYLPSELNAAVLFAQLEVWNIIQSKRHAVWNRYFTELAGWAAANGVRLPIVPAGCEHPAHLFYLLLPSERDRAALIKHLAARGILSVFHYVPLHAAPMGQRLGYRAEDLPITVDVSERLLRLPLYAGMSDEDVDEVVAAILQWQPSTHPAISA